MYSFIYFWLRWVFIAEQAFSLAAVSRDYALVEVCGAPYFNGLSCRRAQSLGCLGLSSCGSWALECWLRSGTQVQLPCGMRDLLRPGIKPMSPALAGGINHWAAREIPLETFSVSTHNF